MFTASARLLSRVRPVLRRSLLATSLASLAMLATSPFAAPFRAATEAEIAASIERLLAREVTPDWVEGEAAKALATDPPDRQRLSTLFTLADRQELALDPALRARIETAAAGPGFAADCLACMANIAECPSVAAISCGLAFELSPLGDIAALSRQGSNALSWDEVDEIEAALATAGLGASVAVVVTGGGSAVVKGGVTLLRLDRRAGTLSPRLSASVLRAARAGDRTALLAHAAPLADLRRATGSSRDAVLLLRGLNTPGEVTRVFRIARVVGPQTGAVAEVLGPARLLRTTVRLTRTAVTSIGLLLATALQAALFLGSLIVRGALRG